MDQPTFGAALRRKAPGNGTSKWGGLLTSSKRGKLTWADCGPEDLLAAVASVTEDGAALLLSKTSDGGALLVQVLVSQVEKPKFYAASMAELNEVLSNLASA